MPEPTKPPSRFDGAARYMPAAVVRAKAYPEGGLVELSDGPVGIPLGHVLAIPPAGVGGPYVTGADAFAAEHMGIEGHPLLNVTRSTRTVRAVLVRGRMHVEGDFETHDARSFMRDHARVTEDGRRALCHCSSHLDLQRRLIEGHGQAGAAHAAALGAWRDHLSATAFDADTQQQVNAYDLAGAEVRDALSDGMAAIMGSAPPEGLVIDEVEGTARLREGSVLETLVSATGVPPQAFVEARHMPSYEVATYRALTRRLLSPFLGEQALETVLVTGCHVGAHPLEGWARGGEMVADAEPSTLPEMPGYTTSYMRHYRREGVDVLCFEDAGGGYAYCWPSPEEPSPRP